MLQAINAREAELTGLTDGELRDRAANLRRQAELPEVFVLVRETARLARFVEDAIGRR